MDDLKEVSMTEIPKAAEEIRNAPIRHTAECDVCDMKKTVEEILGLR